MQVRLSSDCSGDHRVGMVGFRDANATTAVSDHLLKYFLSPLCYTIGSCNRVNSILEPTEQCAAVKFEEFTGVCLQ